MSLARIGDVIETTVRLPVPGKIRMRLDTAASCAKANELLLDKQSGWKLASQVCERSGWKELSLGGVPTW
jgi:hypothetical protein